jgi:uncharacterized OB-fold protein
VSQPDNLFLLPERVRPVALSDGLDEPYWTGLRQERIVLQYCRPCREYQWGPEYVCYRSGADALQWVEVPKDREGRYHAVVYSWERVWHPVHPSLVRAVPYVVVLVALPDASHVRLLGNLVDPPPALVPIGSELDPVYEHHDAHTLLLWRLSDRGSPAP